MAVTASQAGRNLSSLIEQVNDDRTPIEITSSHGDAVLVSRADYGALPEITHAPGDACASLRVPTPEAQDPKCHTPLALSALDFRRYESDRS